MAQHQQGPFSLPDQNILFIAKEVFEAGDSTVSSSSVAHRHQFQVEGFRQEVRLNLYLQEPALQSARGLATLRGEASQARYRHARTFFVQHVTGFQLSSSGESHLPLLPRWHRLSPLPFIALCAYATRNNAFAKHSTRASRPNRLSMTPTRSIPLAATMPTRPDSGPVSICTASPTENGCTGASSLLHC